MKRLVSIFFLALLAGCGAAPAMVTQGTLSVALTTDPAPALAGRDTNVVLTVTESGAPLNTSTVGIRRSMPGMEHDSDHELVAAEHLGAGRYQATTDFPMGGRWDVAVVVAGHDGSSRTLILPIEVEQP